PLLASPSSQQHYGSGSDAIQNIVESSLQSSSPLASTKTKSKCPRSPFSPTGSSVVSLLVPLQLTTRQPSLAAPVEHRQIPCLWRTLSRHSIWKITKPSAATPAKTSSVLLFSDVFLLRHLPTIPQRQELHHLFTLLRHWPRCPKRRLL